MTEWLGMEEQEEYICCICKQPSADSQGKEGVFMHEQCLMDNYCAHCGKPIDPDDEDTRLHYGFYWHLPCAIEIDNRRRKRQRG